jgi:hypothetical protein
MVTTAAIYSREQLGISRTLLGGAISSAYHPCREIHLLSADAPRSYCCLLLPRGFSKSFVKNEKTGRGGGDRKQFRMEFQGLRRNVGER